MSKTVLKGRSVSRPLLKESTFVEINRSAAGLFKTVSSSNTRGTVSLPCQLLFRLEIEESTVQFVAIQQKFGNHYQHRVQTRQTKKLEVVIFFLLAFENSHHELFVDMV